MTQVVPVKTLSPSEKEKLLQSAIYGLFQDQAFYGGLLQELTISFREDMPTAAIAYDPKKQEFNIYLGTEFFQKLKPEERVAVLKHEVMHFTSGHMMRFPWTKDTPQEERIKYNLAGDMAINQFINNLPKDCVDVNMWKKQDGTPFPKFQSMEVYYDLIKNNWDANKDSVCSHKKAKPGEKGTGTPCEDCKGNGHGQQVLDEHEWEELSEEEKKDMLKEAKDIFQRSIEKVSTDSSLLPDHIKDMLREIEVAISGLNYKKILKDTIKRTVCSSDRENTWNRRNKRYDVYAPGSRQGKLPKCSMYIDTSGSISITECNEFLQVISGFLKAGSRRCEVSLWHTDVYYTQKYKLNDKLSEEVFQSGGTDVGSVLKKIHEQKPDLSVILTDGYFSKTFDKPINSDIIWVISKGGDINHPYAHIGKTIRMT